MHHVLLLLTQMPQDPTSGAARSLASYGRLLAAARDPNGRPRFSVRVVATTSRDGAQLERGKSPDALRALGCRVAVHAAPRSHGRTVLAVDDAGLRCRLLDTGGGHHHLDPLDEDALDALLADELRSHPPDIVLTFGAREREDRRRRACAATGASIVFAAALLDYLDRQPPLFDPPDAIDRVIVPSAYVRDRFLDRFPGLAVDEVPDPLLPAEVLATGKREPVFVTFVNPTPAKGLFFYLRLADELATRRPDIPLLVVESRGTRQNLLVAGRLCGIDLARHPSVLVTPPVPQPRDLFASTRLLLVPSAWHEPSGRVAAEALLNGIPPIVSDRGGLPGQVAGGGIVLPLPPHFTAEDVLAPPAASVEPWIEAIVPLCDDEAAYAQACARAASAGLRFSPDAVSKRLTDRLLDLRPPPSRRKLGPG